jgi:hypothetical protein
VRGRDVTKKEGWILRKFFSYGFFTAKTQGRKADEEIYQDVPMS